MKHTHHSPEGDPQFRIDLSLLFSADADLDAVRALLGGQPNELAATRWVVARIHERLAEAGLKAAVLASSYSVEADGLREVTPPSESMLATYARLGTYETTGGEALAESWAHRATAVRYVKVGARWFAETPAAIRLGWLRAVAGLPKRRRVAFQEG